MGRKSNWTSASTVFLSKVYAPKLLKPKLLLWQHHTAAATWFVLHFIYRRYWLFMKRILTSVDRVLWPLGNTISYTIIEDCVLGKSLQWVSNLKYNTVYPIFDPHLIVDILNKIFSWYLSYVLFLFAVFAKEMKFIQPFNLWFIFSNKIHHF